MELNASFHIQLGGLKLANRAVKRHGREANRSHGMQEVIPRDFAWRRRDSRVKEDSPEDLQSARIHAQNVG